MQLGKIDDHILDTTLQIPKGIKYLRGYYLARLSTSWPEIWSDLWGYGNPSSFYLHLLH